MCVTKYKLGSADNDNTQDCRHCMSCFSEGRFNTLTSSWQCLAGRKATCVGIWAWPQQCQQVSRLTWLSRRVTYTNVHFKQKDETHEALTWTVQSPRSPESDCSAQCATHSGYRALCVSCQSLQGLSSPQLRSAQKHGLRRVMTRQICQFQPVVASACAVLLQGRTAC